MKETKQEFQFKLPARISGLVFWGLVLISLLSAVLILGKVEAELEAKHLIATQHLAYEIESVLEKHYQYPVLGNNNGRIKLVINTLRDVLGYKSVSLREGDHDITSGVIKPDYKVYQLPIYFYPKNTQKLSEITASVYFPNEKATISELRKNVLLIVGCSVFVFGFFLQKILNRLISKPFLDMVTTAQHFSLGNKSIKFNDKRQDEFGYLGGFINEAIQKLLKQQDDLNVALGRAARSEDELKEERDRAEVTLASITDAVISVDVKGYVQFLNPSAESLLGIAEKDAVNKKFEDITHITSDITGEPLPDTLEECFSTGEVYEFPEYSSLINKESVAIAIEASVAAMKDDSDRLIGAVIVIQDVSHTRKLTRQLSYQASHDMLTGLYNRRKFEELLSEALVTVKEEGSQHTFCYLDLDQFKIVNDTCGHVAGDELLRQIPDLFHHVLRSGDVLARLGGDEFGILLENCNVQQAAQISEKIRQQIKDYRFVWDDKTFEIGASIGVVGITVDNADLTEILSSADVACYAAKDSGRNAVHIYESMDDETALRHGEMHWTGRIQHALNDDRFILYRQPIVSIADDGVGEHYEILVRMLSNSGEIIPPGAFLPAAERYNLMCNIDRWVIAEAFKYIVGERGAGSIIGTDTVISINLSGDSINDNTMLTYIIAEKEKHDMDLGNVCFEITETVAISNLTKATDFMKSLKNFGCRFSLDDFGSGLSSFAYLKNLPVDYLKIDGSFVKEINNDEIDRAMVTSIHQIGDVMSLKTVAEKVENVETLNILKEIGVDYAQGFHLGIPEPIYKD